eukprot:gene12051-5547_t
MGNTQTTKEGEIPTSSKDYEILEKFKGKTNTNEFVYKIQSKKNSKKIYVVKGVNLPLSEYPEFEKMLHMTISLDHPNIIKNHLWFKEYINYNIGGHIEKIVRYSLVMDFEEKGDLTQNFENYEIEEDYMNVIIQICLGLNYLHSKNIIHRDIKPHNVLVSKDGTLKLCDLEFLRSDGSSSKTIAGTTHYMAPEIIKRKYSEKVDIYALGKTILHLFNKTPDVHWIPEDYLILKLMKESCPKLHDICVNCLEIDPSKRMTAKEILSSNFDFKNLCEEYSPKNNEILQEIVSIQLEFLNLSDCLKILNTNLNHSKKIQVIKKLRNAKEKNISKMIFFYYLLSFDHYQLEYWSNKCSLTKLDIDQYFEKYNEKDRKIFYAICLLYGCGFEKNELKAFEMLLELSNTNNANAQYYIGRCYHLGCGVEKNFQKGIEFFISSSEKGNSNAQCSVGYCYKNGDGVKKDMKKAVDYYTLSSNQRNSNAQCNMGLCYQYGEGVEIDLKKAFEFYQMSSDQGCSNAQCYLACCFINGMGVEKNIEKGIELLKSSAEQGDPRGIELLKKYSL